MLSEVRTNELLREWLIEQGYRIVCYAPAPERGFDIEAEHRRTKSRLLVEVKGTANEEGQAFNDAQIKKRAAEALFKAIQLRDKFKNDGAVTIGMAFPDDHRYRELIRSVDQTRRALGIEVFRVHEDGRVEKSTATLANDAPVQGTTADPQQRATAGRTPTRGRSMCTFARYIGIDYSGAGTPMTSLKGLRVFVAEGEAQPSEVLPPPSRRKYWTRRGIAEWLVVRLAEDVPSLVGIDHGFSFPLRYFEVHRLKPDWPAFLDDFQRHWPTDEDHVYVDFVRDGSVGNGAARMGNTRWRRLTEERAGGAKSVFHFDVQGSVAKSAHAGIPWLRYLRRRPGQRVHFWPFDGWDIPAERSAVAEVYPRLWSRKFDREGRTDDQHDAFSIAAWLSRADRDGSLAAYLKPDLAPPERAVAQVEGWILGAQ
jgi:hypothetical protein